MIVEFAITALKVTGGFLLIAAILIAIHFPYQVDPPDTKKASSEHRSYYADVYTARPRPAQTIREEPKEDSRYVMIAREAIKSLRIVPRVTEFADRYGLREKRVLDIGAGTGYLQDVVPDYVGLDISPSARRYFHKPFVEASATDIPFRDNEFDAAWSIWVLEHVPKPEHALAEIRRVVKNGGVLFLAPAWDCPWWLAQGYQVRPYSDFGTVDKLRKASLSLLSSPYYRSAHMRLVRTFRRAQARLSGKPTQFHYTLLQPNYREFWVADSDAINGLSYHETLMWFTSRGDECLNCTDDPLLNGSEIVIQVRK